MLATLLVVRLPVAGNAEALSVVRPPLPTRPPTRRAGRRPNLYPSVGVLPCQFARFPQVASAGSAALAGQLLRSLLVVLRRAWPDISQSARAAAAHVQRRFSRSGPVYVHTHSPGLMILSGQYSHPGSPAGHALRCKENLQCSNMGAAFCVLHSDTSSCGRHWADRNAAGF